MIGDEAGRTGGRSSSHAVPKSSPVWYQTSRTISAIVNINTAFFDDRRGGGMSV